MEPMREIGRMLVFAGAALGLAAALAVGTAAYLVMCKLLGVRELALLRSFARFGRASPAGGGGQGPGA